LTDLTTIQLAYMLTVFSWTVDKLSTNLSGINL